MQINRVMSSQDVDQAGCDIQKKILFISRFILRWQFGLPVMIYILG